MARLLRTVVQGIYSGDSPQVRGGRLWFADLFGRQVMSAALDGGDLRSELHLHDRPQAIGWLPDGDLLVLCMDGRRIYRRSAKGAIQLHADLSGIATGPCSGMRVDAYGRAYVGNYGFDLEGWISKKGRARTMAEFRPTARLACVNLDGTVWEAAADFDVLTNAPVITPDEKTLIVGEMYGRRLVAFDRNSDDGTLTNRRIWASVGPRRPDALALDAEGAIWFTNPSAAECVRVAEGGQILESIDTGIGCYGCGLHGTSLFINIMPSASPGTADTAPNSKIMVVEIDIPSAVPV